MQIFALNCRKKNSQIIKNDSWLLFLLLLILRPALKTLTFNILLSHVKCICLRLSSPYVRLIPFKDFFMLSPLFIKQEFFQFVFLMAFFIYIYFRFLITKILFCSFFNIAPNRMEEKYNLCRICSTHGGVAGSLLDFCMDTEYPCTLSVKHKQILPSQHSSVSTFNLNQLIAKTAILII